MASYNRRYLIVPALNLAEESIIRARDLGSGDTAEVGLAVRQPALADSSEPLGDIRPVLSGVPEVEAEGVLRVTKAGPEDAGRWSWSKGGSSTAYVKQNSNVFGRRPDFIDTSLVETAQLAQPKLLELADGNVLLFYVLAVSDPVRLRRTMYQHWLTRLDGETDQWSVPTIPFVAPTRVAGDMAWTAGVTAVQFPDTEEVLAFHFWGDSPVGTYVPDYRYLVVSASTDGGSTWIERNVFYLGGGTNYEVKTSVGGYDIPLMIPFWVNPNHPVLPPEADRSYIQSVDSVLLASGRIVLYVLTQRGYVWAFISDDRAETFTATGIYRKFPPEGGEGADSAEATYKPGGMITATLDRDGVIYGAVAAPVANPLNNSLGRMWAVFFSSVDGVSHQLAEDAYGAWWGGGTPDGFFKQAMGGVAVTRPDGRPSFYIASHNPAFYLGAGDWLHHMVAVERETDRQLTGARMGDSWPNWIDAFALHCTPGDGLNRPYGEYWDPSGAMVVPSTHLVLYGFRDVAACVHRGQVLVAAIIKEEDWDSEGEGPPKGDVVYVSSHLAAFRTNYWQPMAENLDPVGNLPAIPAAGLLYNRAWDGYSFPSAWAWTQFAGGGSATLETVKTGGAAADVGGRMRISTVAPAARYFEMNNFPAPDASHAGHLRIVMAPISGGDTASNEIGVVWILADGGQAHGIHIRLEVAGPDWKIAVFDNLSGGQLGVTVVISPLAGGVNQEWVEILAALWADHSGGTPSDGEASVFVRAYYRETDPDWEQRYTQVCLSGVTGMFAGSDTLKMGHIAGGTTTSDWKSLHLNRSDGAGFTPPFSIPTTDSYLDDESDARRWTYAAAYRTLKVEDGRANFMRSPQITTVPPQWLSRGVYAHFRGEATTEGNYDIATAYEYGRQSLFTDPVVQEWRSHGDVDLSKPYVPSVEIVLETEAAFPIIYRPSGGHGVAFFGRNWPRVNLQFNNSDSWGAYDYEVILDTANSPWPKDRISSIWSTSPTMTVDVDSAMRLVHVRLSATSDEPIWRPHQFRWNDVGPRYYFVTHVAVEPSYVPVVVPILDNSEQVLILSTPIATADPPTGLEAWPAIDTFDIISDRFATQLLMTGEPPIPPFQGRRFMRVAIFGSYFIGEGFMRAGRMIYGPMVDISSPDFAWGWTIDNEPGAERIDLRGGPSYNRKRTAPRRSWAVDYDVLRSAHEYDPTFTSPIRGNHKPWQEPIDVMRNAGAFGQQVALIFDGDRARHFSGADVVRVACDHNEVALVRAEAVGNFQHAVFECKDVDLPGGVETLPRPIGQVRGIVFREEF